VDNFGCNSKKNDYLNYKNHLWDNALKCNMEEGIVVNFEKVPKEVYHLLFFVIVNDISKKEAL
jgi:hypothetical protein